MIASTLWPHQPPGSPRRRRSRWGSPTHPLGLCLVALCLALPVVACTPAADSEDAATPAPRPRITAEHPVTSPAAVEAGLLDRSATGAMPGPGRSDGDRAGAEGAVSLTPLLPAEDVGRSAGFYTAVLGFDLVASEPARPPFRRVELVRGAARLVLVEAGRLARETPRLSAEPAAAPRQSSSEPPEEASEEVATEDPVASSAASTGPDDSRPVIRLAFDDLTAVAQRLADEGIPAVDRDGGGEGREIAVADPAGNRLLLVSAKAP